MLEGFAEERGYRKNDEGRYAQIDFISSDSYLYPGPGFRFIQLPKGRYTLIKGQAVYNVKALHRDIANIKKGKTIYTPWDSHAPGYDEKNIKVKP